MNIFIGCSSGEKIDAIYKNISRCLIKKISKIDKLNLVFGGCHKGIMSICYDEFKHNNKQVIGISPRVYEKDVKELDCDEVIIADTTIERFNEIYKRSDIFLFLPGGVGTLSELFNTIEENRTNDSNKKLIIIYNKEYFYTDIIKELYKMYEDGFINNKLTDYLVIESDDDKIVELLQEKINRKEEK